MTHGGKRKGGGRKKGHLASHTIDVLEMRKKVVAFVNERMDPLLKAQEDLALGHYKAITNKDGKLVDVYRVSPDGNAIQYFLNQGIGKPRETLEVQADIKLKIDF